MRRLLVLSALVALTAAESTPSPDKKCKCEIGTRPEHSHEDDFIVLYRFHDTWDQDCGHSGEDLCREECETERDVMQAFGGWSVTVPDDNSTLGEIACQNLGRDVTGEGVESQLYTAVCEEEFREAGHGFHERLCCKDGSPLECDGPHPPEPPMF